MTSNNIQQEKSIDINEIESDTGFLRETTDRINDETSAKTHKPFAPPFNPIEHTSNTRVHCVIVDDTDVQIWVETGKFKNPDGNMEFYVVVQIADTWQGTLPIAKHVYRTDSKSQDEIIQDLQDDDLVEETVNEVFEIFEQGIIDEDRM